MATYRLVPQRSTVQVEARSTLHPIHGEASGLSGTLDLGVAAGRLDVTRPWVASVSLPVAALRSANPLQDRELARRIDARRYPTIDGVVTAVEYLGDAGDPAGGGTTEARWRVTGDVTFRGVRRTHTDEVTVAVQPDGAVAIDGRSTFDIRDFGMEPPRILVLRVYPDVVVRVRALAVPAGA